MVKDDGLPRTVRVAPLPSEEVEILLAHQRGVKHPGQGENILVGRKYIRRPEDYDSKDSNNSS